MNQRRINLKRSIGELKPACSQQVCSCPAPQHLGACGRVPRMLILSSWLLHASCGYWAWPHAAATLCSFTVRTLSEARNREDEQWGQSWILFIFPPVQLLFLFSINWLIHYTITYHSLIVMQIRYLSNNKSGVLESQMPARQLKQQLLQELVKD